MAKRYMAPSFHISALKNYIYACILFLILIVISGYIFVSPSFITIIDIRSTMKNGFYSQPIDLRMDLHEFATGRWYGSSRYGSLADIPNFPPQITIAKVCPICNTSYWMAFPTNFTLHYFYFAGENGIRVEMSTGIWDVAETRLANAVLSFGCQSGKSPDLMVDVGMNVGYFTGMALAAGCRVIAFEPTKYHHTYAAITALLSGHQDRFTLHKVAASNTTGTEIPYNDWSVDISANRQQAGRERSYVLTTRIDDVVYEDVLYMKIDVEKHEPEVFHGLTKLLETKTVLVIVWENSHISGKQSTKRPADYLAELGYYISDLHHGGAENFVALHPKIDPRLRRIIVAMKKTNIDDVLAHHGLQ